MSYRHGVYASEQATGLVPPVRVNTALPVVVGTAPVETLEDGAAPPVNSPKLIFSFAEFVRQFGSLPPGAKIADYTLYEFANIYLARYGVCPVVFINVFDPAKHYSTIPDASGFIGKRMEDLEIKLNGETRDYRSALTLYMQDVLDALYYPAGIGYSKSPKAKLRPFDAGAVASPFHNFSDANVHPKWGTETARNWCRVGGTCLNPEGVGSKA